MHLPKKLFFLPGLLVLALILAWLTWVNQARVHRIEYVSGLAGGSELQVDPESPTAYEDGLRVLIFPDAVDESYQWILQTEAMMTTGSWRLRRVDYDNAPTGRAVESTSPYRWTLAALAKIDQLVSGRPIALGVERASILAGPVLHVVLLVMTGFYVARRSSILAGVLSALALAAAFPVSESMLGGRPGSAHLSILFVLWSVLPLVTPGRQPPGESTTPPGSAFILAGLFGALGLWTDFALQAPILIAIAVGGLAVSLLPLLGVRFENRGSPPWRRWGLAGAVVCILTYLIEGFPDNLAWFDLKQNHPVYAMAWALTGELLHRVSQAVSRRPATRPINRLQAGLIVFGLVLVPLLLILDSARSFLPFSAIGTTLSGTVLGSDLVLWTAQSSVGLVTLATVLPSLILLGSIGIALTGSDRASVIASAMIAWTPAAITFAMAFFQPAWWPMAAVLTIPVLVVSMAHPGRLGNSSTKGWLWVAITVVAVSPGPWLHYNYARAASEPAISDAEVTALLERTLSHWLSRRIGPNEANILAPPRLTVSLIFHGGLKGVSTPFLGNREGFTAAVRLAAATSADEAKALAESRKLSHIIMPSWDDYLNQYARIGAAEEASTLVGMLHRWLPPRWLAPLAYPLPRVEGFEKDYAAIFRVVEVQDNATALSRLAEYFLEMGQMEAAVSVGQALEYSFPGDLNALTARAQVALAGKNLDQFRTLMDQVVALIDGGSGDYLVWDRRISLAIMLAQFESALRARVQLEICLEETDEALIRSLSTLPLFRFVSLMTAFNLDFDQPELRPIALELLPETMRIGL